MISPSKLLALLALVPLALGQSTTATATREPPDLWPDVQPYPFDNPTTTYTRVTSVTVAPSACPTRIRVWPYAIVNHIPVRPIPDFNNFQVNQGFIFTWHRSRHDYNDLTIQQANLASSRCFTMCRRNELTHGICRSFWTKWDNEARFAARPHWTCYTFGSQIRPEDLEAASAGLLQAGAYNRVCDAVLTKPFKRDMPSTFETSTKTEPSTWDDDGGFTISSDDSTVTPTSDPFTWDDDGGFTLSTDAPTVTPTSEPFTWDLSGFDPRTSTSTQASTTARRTPGVAGGRG